MRSPRCRRVPLFRMHPGGRRPGSAEFLLNLRKGFEENGITVRPWWWLSFRPRETVLLIHWLEGPIYRHLFGEGNSLQLTKDRIKLALLKHYRRRGLTVVFFAHNILPHGERLLPDRIDSVWRHVRKISDYVVYLSDESQSLLHSEEAGAREVVIKHPVSRHQNRLGLSRSSGLIRLLSVGGFEPRKEITSCFEAIKHTKQLQLTITQRIFSSQLLHTIYESRASKLPPNVRVEFKIWTKRQLNLELAKSDFLLLSQRKILNSGVIFLGLGFGVPVICPRSLGTTALEGVFGKAWIRLYEHPLVSEQLEELVRYPSENSRPPGVQAHYPEVAFEPLIGMLLELESHR